MGRGEHLVAVPGQDPLDDTAHAVLVLDHQEPEGAAGRCEFGLLFNRAARRVVAAWEEHADRGPHPLL